MSDKTKLLIGFSFMIGIVILAGLVFAKSKKDVELLRKHGVSTVGVFVEIVDMKGSYFLYEFYVNGEKIRNSDPGEVTLAVLNQMYEVRYIPSDPTISQMNFLKPIDELGRFGAETTGKIESIDFIKSKNKWLVQYSYDEGWKITNGREFLKKIDTSRFKEGSQVKVRYSAYRKGKKELPRKNYMILE